MSNDSWISSASQPARPVVQDRKVARINATAEQRRRDQAAQVEIRARAAELAIERRRAELALKQQQKDAKQATRDERRESWRQARAHLAAKINRAVPTTGRRIMIAGPILAPMAVAWVGQIGFAHHVLRWILPGAIVFAASWELTTAFCGWMYHQARQAGDHGNLFRAATWVSATGAGVMNYWHNCPLVPRLGADGVVRDVIDISPTPKAVAYGVMSLVGIAVWELYCSLVHRKTLRDRGIIPAVRPRFGVARWFRYTRITWVAWSLSIKDGHATTEQAWNAALTELAYRARAKARAKAARKATKSGRTPIRITVVHGSGSTVRQWGPTEWTQPPIVWIPNPVRTTLPDHLEPVVRTTPAQVVQTTHERVDRTTPGPVVRTTEETTLETAARTTSGPTSRTTSRGGSKRGRRTRDQLREQLKEKVKEIYEHGGEIQVKPLATELKANRKTVRELLDEMNVRPMVRKAAGE